MSRNLRLLHIDIDGGWYANACLCYFLFFHFLVEDEDALQVAEEDVLRIRIFRLEEIVFSRERGSQYELVAFSLLCTSVCSLGAKGGIVDSVSLLLLYIHIFLTHNTFWGEFETAFEVEVILRNRVIDFEEKLWLIQHQLGAGLVDDVRHVSQVDGVNGEVIDVVLHFTRKGSDCDVLQCRCRGEGNLIGECAGIYIIDIHSTCDDFYVVSKDECAVLLVSRSAGKCDVGYFGINGGDGQHYRHFTIAIGRKRLIG